MNKPIFIIEHLEPKIWPWCLIEYKNISRIVGKENLWFTNIDKSENKKLLNFGKVFNKSVKKINLPIRKSCVLDPLSKKTLNYKEAKEIKYFIFGGILGEEKINGRTQKELSVFIKKVKKRNLGMYQFSTDNAVFVVKKILKGKSLDSLKFRDGIEIKINDIESLILPYRYLLIKGKPNIPRELIKYLKEKKGF